MKYADRVWEARHPRISKTAALISAALAVVVAGLFAPAALAAPGDLDLTFGGSGKVRTNMGATVEYGRDVVMQGDKTVVVGITDRDASGYDTALARYNPDGTLDATFGEGGKRVTDLGGGRSEDIQAVALQGEKILVVGSVRYDDFVVARYDANGTLDTTFGEGGKKTITFGGYSNDYGNAIVVQGDKILVGGSTSDPDTFASDLALARLTANGDLDTGFGEGGKKTTDIYGAESDAIQGLVPYGGGVIAVGGSTDYVDDIMVSQDFVLARYNANGDLDPNFSNDGIREFYFRGYSNAWANEAVMQGDRLIVGGYTDANGSNDFALAGFDPATGQIDESFGTDGQVVTDVGSGTEDEAADLALQGDKILVAGVSGGDFGLTRYNADGALDTSFGTGGKVRTNIFGSLDNATGLAVQSDGKPVLAGSSGYYGGDGSPVTDFALARYKVAANTVPTAEDVSTSTTLDQSRGVYLRGSDEDNDRLTYTITDLPDNGKLYYEQYDADLNSQRTDITEAGTTLPLDAELYYEPNPGYNNTSANPDTFRYRVNDGTADSEEATVSVTIKDEAAITLGGMMRTYTGAAQAPTATTDPAGLDVTFEYYEYDEATDEVYNRVSSPTNVGSYWVQATVEDADHGGYKSGVMRITRAPLAIKANDATKVYGTANPAFTVGYTGFVGGDDAGDLGGQLGFDTQAGLDSPVGEYPVTPYGQTSRNYAITYGAGKLKITKATAGVYLFNLSATYDGRPKSAAVRTNPEWLDFDLTYTQNGQPVANPTAIGTYSVTATINEPDYQGSATGTFRIQDRTAPNTTISGPTGATTSNKPTFTFGGSDDVTPPGGLKFYYRVDDGDSVLATGNTATLGGEQGLTEGPHTITVAATDSADNSDQTPATASFTVAAPAQCSDGRDNDSDGKTDFGNDPGCTSTSDNDEVGTPALSINDAPTVSEGNTGTRNATFTITRSGDLGRAATVRFATANGTASDASDFAAATGTVTFAPGQNARTIGVAIQGDTTDEPASETFSVNLSGASGATVSDGRGQGTISDDDAPPTLAIADAVPVLEGAAGTRKTVAFTVSLGSASGNTVTVNFATADATASAGTDYTARSGTLTFSPGQTKKSVTVTVIGDARKETNETFRVTLSSVTNARVTDQSAFGTIRNDD